MTTRYSVRAVVEPGTVIDRDMAAIELAGFLRGVADRLNNSEHTTVALLAIEPRTE